MTTTYVAIADRLAEVWDLEGLKFHVATPQGEIYFASRHGLPVALKVQKPGAGSSVAHQALLHFSGIGAVRLLTDCDEGFLMERVEPGTPLSNLVLEGRDDEAMQIICQVAAELHKAGPVDGIPGLPIWHDRYDKIGETSESSGLSKTTYKRAKGLYLEMVLSQGKVTVLHGDLHHDNILSDHLRDWVAIDPHGYQGEPAFEFGCALRNPGGDVRLFAKPDILTRRLDMIVEQTNLDRTRLLLWAYTTAVLSALWSLEGGENPGRGITTATALETLL